VFPTVVRLEDGVMQLFERLVAADFDHAADFLIGELLTGRLYPLNFYARCGEVSRH
jgi:hypothetical protein